MIVVCFFAYLINTGVDGFMYPKELQDRPSGMLTNDQIDNGRIWSRLHKTWCFPTCCCACNTLFRPCRHMVSRSKQRTIKDDFDLDMVAIHPRIYVHGFPAVGLEHLYRNPRGEIRRYMDTHHHGKYKVYNFCCEYGRGYDPSVYYGRVERYPFKDHNTPPLETMVDFANSAKTWLDADPENVVTMHCKAGKGRAGLMCCVLLVRMGYCGSAEEAMALYDRTRVKNNKGLTVTSQRKFVMFYEQLWRRFWSTPVGVSIGSKPPSPPGKYVIPVQPTVRITKISILHAKEGSIRNASVAVYRGTQFSPLPVGKAVAKSPDQMDFDVDCVVKGNFKVKIDQKPGVLGAAKVLDLWHNTLFLDADATVMVFPLNQLDIKRRKVHKYGEGICLRLTYSKVENERLVPAPSSLGDGSWDVSQHRRTPDSGPGQSVELRSRTENTK